jgi:hypothetical protein
MSSYEYWITEDEENHLVHLVVEGQVTKTEGENIIIETRRKAVEKQLPILCDISQAKINATLADWFFLVRNKEIYPKAPSEKTAILIGSGTRDIFSFFENVTRNVGFNFKIFFSEEDAREWLKSGE